MGQLYQRTEEKLREILTDRSQWEYDAVVELLKDLKVEAAKPKTAAVTKGEWERLCKMHDDLPRRGEFKLVQEINYRFRIAGCDEMTRDEFQSLIGSSKRMLNHVSLEASWNHVAHDAEEHYSAQKAVTDYQNAYVAFMDEIDAVAKKYNIDNNTLLWAIAEKKRR